MPLGGKHAKCEVCGKIKDTLGLAKMPDGKFVCRSQGKNNCKGWYVPERCVQLNEE